jgi:hypothetical protein
MQQIAGRCIDRGCSCRARWFSKWVLSKSAALLGGGSKIRVDDDGGRAGITMVALVSAALSSSTAEAVSRRGQGDANARTRNNR